MNRPERKPNRLPGYDYSFPGAYFITICTKDRKCILSRIYLQNVGEGLAPPAIELTDCGIIIERQIQSVDRRFPNFSVDKYIIMPNHVHLIISANESAGGPRPSPTVSDVVCAIKSVSAVECKKKLGISNIWQRSFHDHIIRNESDYRKIWEYVDSNAQKWQEDCFFVPEET